MKKLVLLLMLMVGLSGISQTALTRIPPPKFSVIVTQDFKLAFTEDDHGNVPYTADIHAKVHLHTYTTPAGNYGVVGLKWQYADLSPQNLNRVAIEAGHRFNLIYVQKGLNDIPLISVTPLASYGLLWRQGGSTDDSFEVGFDAALDITEWLSFVVGNYWTERWELGEWRYNFNGGFRVGF